MNQSNTIDEAAAPLVTSEQEERVPETVNETSAPESPGPNSRPKLVSVYSLLENSTGGKQLDHIRIQRDETPILLVTSDVPTPANLHFNDTAEYRGYLHCNGASCPFCRAGRARNERILIPVYDLTEGRVRILPVGISQAPNALLPQLFRDRTSGPRVVFISMTDDKKYRVTFAPLNEGVQSGAAAIADFVRQFEAGEIDVNSVFPRFDNDFLASIPSIARVLSLKG